MNILRAIGTFHQNKSVAAAPSVLKRAIASGDFSLNSCVPSGAMASGAAASFGPGDRSGAPNPVSPGDRAKQEAETADKEFRARESRNTVDEILAAAQRGAGVVWTDDAICTHRFLKPSSTPYTYRRVLQLTNHTVMRLVHPDKVPDDYKKQATEATQLFGEWMGKLETR